MKKFLVLIVIIFVGVKTFNIAKDFILAPSEYKIVQETYQNKLLDPSENHNLQSVENDFIKGSNSFVEKLTTFLKSFPSGITALLIGVILLFTFSRNLITDFITNLIDFFS